MGVNESELGARLERVAATGVEPTLVAGLDHLIRDADDIELFRVNPLSYARVAEIDEVASIELFLHATKTGLFQMEWNIVCRTCGNVFKSFRRLEKVDSHFHCTLCDLENESRLDDVIQVVFTVDRTVRDIVFHHPEKLTLEQLLFQYHYSREARTRVGETLSVDWLRKATVELRWLETGEQAHVETALEEGALLIRDWRTSISFFVAQPGEKTKRAYALAIGDDGLDPSDIPTAEVPIPTPLGTLLLPAVHGLAPSDLELTITNRARERRPLWIVKYPSTFLEREVALVETAPALSAKRLLNTAVFRRLFRSEAPGDGAGLTVTDLTYLFTDLKNSTAMYDSIGDATAYNLVMEHFDTIGSAVAGHNGAVIKTIGDAVMATFVDPADAVTAALDMVERIRTSDDDLQLKVGVHRGHSIAVSLNERLDYFGQNVNIAARTQQLAGASEVFLTQDVLDAPGVAEMLGDCDLERVASDMNGVGEEIPVYRVG